MEVWASYSLNDLLLFSPDTYFRLYEIHNAELWPLHLLMLAVSFALLVLTKNKELGWSWVVFLLLGVLWGIVGWFFLYQQYAQINTAAPWFALGFGIQSVLLIAIGVFRRNGSTNRGWGYDNLTDPGLLLFLYALMVHPLIGIISGRSWEGVELFGLAPDPTALGTLGIVLMYHGKLAYLLAVIPLLWVGITGLTYLAMNISTGMIAIGALALALICRRFMPLTIGNNRK
jgi:hypothetical protein